MEQSQVKFSHCWMHTPMLAHESSWQVVLGPGKRQEREKREVPQEKNEIVKQHSERRPGLDNAKTHAERNAL